MRLERLDQPSLFLGLEITFDGGGPGEGVGALWAGAGLGLFKIEDGAKGLRFATEGWERGELDLRVSIDEGNGAVGGAEVEADGIEGRLRCLPRFRSLKTKRRRMAMTFKP